MGLLVWVGNLSTIRTILNSNTSRCGVSISILAKPICNRKKTAVAASMVNLWIHTSRVYRRIQEHNADVYGFVSKVTYKRFLLVFICNTHSNKKGRGAKIWSKRLAISNFWGHLRRQGLTKALTRGTAHWCLNTLYLIVTLMYQRTRKGAV